MATTVVNLKGGVRYDVYIGRPSKWGNPFVIGKDGNRATVIIKYEAKLKLIALLVSYGGGDLFGLIAQELKGKTLGCYCKPQACHGDVLAKLAEEA